jgi:DNA-binding transcriptional LysR family regulator
MGKAAGRLAVSQPVVSKAIADLEHALGVRLLDRSQRGVEPTPYGRALIKRGVAIFDEMRQGIEEIEFLSDPTAGEVRIGATDPINAAIVAPVIDRLSRQYPRMTFHVVAGVPGPLRQEVAARNVDFAISRFARPAREEYSEEILFRDALVVATGPNNPLTRRRRKIELAELLSEPWVLDSPNTDFGAMQAGVFRAANRVMDDVLGRRLTVRLTERDPGNGSAAHRHPGSHTVGYILEVSYEVKINDGPVQTLKPGEVFYEAPNALHAISRNASATQPLRYLVIQVSDPTKPATVPE